MKLIFITEARFIRDRAGNVYAESAFSYTLWQRYLMIYSSIYVLARVKYQDETDKSYSFLSSSKGVNFIELPYYIGPYQYLRKKNEISRIIKNFINDNSDSIFVCRAPGALSDIAVKHLTKAKIDYGVEVVGDPWEVFSGNILKQPFNLFFKYIGYKNLKINVSKALAALYVTSDSLQRRYPPAKNTFHVSASDVIIKDNLIELTAKEHSVKDCYEILSIGSLAQLYKAPDILIHAIKILNNKGVNCRLVWLGDGIYMEEMKNLAKKIDIDGMIDFKGNVDSAEVKYFLRQADIFALISRTEGLPRAMIEAMSSGLPCVGTNVGGIPELLENTALVPKDNALMVADKIQKLINNPGIYNEQASRNLLESHKYKESVLSKKRNSFYNYLIDKYNVANGLQII